MRKVHGGREIEITVDVAPDLIFRGERQDLEEMIGNLLDNACKWAVMRVRVSGVREMVERRATLKLAIDDDGPGLAAEERQAALARGGRLDETKPGSGLGLSIVVELARIYGGQFDLRDSELGGLSARLTLPAAGSAGA
jgi:signal transduction histidine kinase